MKKNVSNFPGGLNKDNSNIDRPKGSYSFALNAVNETENGDFSVLSNEESNKICASLPSKYIPLESLYISDNKTVIFSVKDDESSSEIGVVDEECNYETLVNYDLGFKLAHPIDATYRLRRGCESTLYWVDGKNNKPMFYVIEKPEKFQNSEGDFIKGKFELQRSFSSVPSFDEVKVLNSGGNLPQGSYNISVQYLDEDLNPTEWITTSETINIYNDDTTESFLEIQGSVKKTTGEEAEFLNFPITDKAIEVFLLGLDQNFIFYRLAFIQASQGTGLVNDVYFSSKIAIDNNFYTFTGDNYEQKGTLEEVQAFRNIIESAGSVEQVDNILLLGNTQGKQVDLCSLQRFASRISADMTVRSVLSNNISDPANPKNPTVHFSGVGYMPGEIYSFGIVYVFEDGTTTPAYHIPGKGKIINSSGDDLSEDFVFSPGENVYPMGVDNESESARYVDNTTCSSKDYWGVDSLGDRLKDSKIRHHRFPLRSKVKVPLVEEGSTIGGISTYYQVVIEVSGTLNLNCTEENIENGDCENAYEASSFAVVATYTVDGREEQTTLIINPADYSQAAPISIADTQVSNLITSPNIEIISLQEQQKDDTLFDISLPGGPGQGERGDLTYSVAVRDAEFTNEGKVYSNKIYGIKFSNIILPPKEEVGNEKIIGYYIVRNERTEEDKTILDSGVLTPAITNEKYVATGLLFPDFAAGEEPRVSKNVFGVVNPEDKFRNKKYTEFTEIIQEGAFEAEKTFYGKARYRDVEEGTSFDGSVHKTGGGKDDQGGNASDGWSLKAVVRDTITKYSSVTNGFKFNSDSIEKVFHLAALQSQNILPPGQDESEQPLNVFNVSGDNQTGVIEFKDNEEDVDVSNKLPYVYFTKDIQNPYSNFRSLPYYKTSLNMISFYESDGETINENSSETVEFNGDTYISPMRYLNTMWWENRIAKRATKKSFLDILIGSLIILAGTVLLVFGGSGALVIGAGIAVIGGGSLFLSSGIKKANLTKAYLDEYDKGLRETVLDDWVKYEYQDIPCIGKNRSNPKCERYGNWGRVGCCDTPQDDEIQWIADCVTDLWFESQINIGLRHGMNADTPTFLPAPGRIQSGNERPGRYYEHHGVKKLCDDFLPPASALERHVMRKLSVFDANKENKGNVDSQTYIGHPLGEYYGYNLDYLRKNKEKSYFHLPLEYDCCSDCQEDFPTRVAYSTQSFQEDLADNFRIFLPNDYRDIQGETGVITDLFTIKNNLYIHTEEGLWHQPQNYQERVTGDIVSFVGTGGYFNTPPRRILDDNKASGGTRHRTATLKTKNGVFFVSENENKIYQFDGNSLQPISDLGMSTWFKENLKLRLLKDYYAANKKRYPYDDNPSHPFGVGFTSVYDVVKERVIFSKKDKILSDNISQNEDFEICAKEGQLIQFENFSQIIAQYESNGWSYEGLEDCKMRFEKIGYVTETIIGETTQVVDIPLDTIIVPILDSTSMNTAVRQNITETLVAWFPTFQASVNGGNNSITMRTPMVGGENWVEAYPTQALKLVGDNKNVILLSFVDETYSTFHGRNVNGSDIIAPNFNTALGDAQPTASYTRALDNFVNSLHPRFQTFIGISYPIVRSGSTGGECKEYLMHSVAAIEAKNFTAAEIDTLQRNPYLTDNDWENFKNNLRNNVYAGLPVPKDYGWAYKINRISELGGNAGTGDCSADPTFIIPPCVFTQDINEVLAGLQQSETVTVEEEIEVTTPVLQVTFVEGVPAELEKANNSWTMSFSLKIKKWISWHSYLVGFYYYIANAFYSWRYWGSDSKGSSSSFWEHNVKNNYQTFFGERHPFIVEYIAMSENLKTKIWDDITLHTEARVYNEEKKNYYDKRGVTFNKAVFYNTRQCTGTLELKPKEESLSEDFMMEQVVNVTPGTIIIDRNEKDWNLNDIRDIRIDYEQPIFDKNILSLQDEYYTDKVVNSDSLDINKNWEQLESFRDKYLGVRLIFDKFEDVKLVLNFSIETEKESFR